MKYYIIAGEASGDLHASNMMREIKRKDSNAEFRFWGGDLMQEQGGLLVKHYRELAFMGFLVVLANLRTILKNISLCKKDITQFNPDVLILVDYPGFNLRIARFAKTSGFKVCYYISPQVWAWKESRVEQIKKFVDKMYVILPFEEAFFQKLNYNVEYVGHPLLDVIEQRKRSDFRSKHGISIDEKVIALIPGSRKHEIEAMLPVMMKM
ncbi:MAG: lipid-A-disaccharide synthase, partial [Flavobacteriales bacterium]|nr:lipid-A-disaccharide synthase [Flavobacteriales bacterium]